jgi:hypothetical protein
MCLIIDKPEGILFPEDDILSAVAVNDEGFGFMWAEDGVVRFEKGIKYEPEDIVKIIEAFKDKHALFHMRYNTAGESNQSNCHPFKVLDKRVHGHDLFLMHNGTIGKCTPGYNAPPARKALSDTKIFAEEVLRPLLAKYGPEALDNRVLRELVEEFIGSGSKVVLLDGTGAVIRLNGDKGDERHGCWVSNTYSFNRTHRVPAVTNTYGYGRYGGTTGPGGSYETVYQRTQREQAAAAARKAKLEAPLKAVVKLVPPDKKEAAPVPSTPSAPVEDPPKDILSEFSELDYFLNNPLYVAEEDIEDFVYNNPDEAVELIYELLTR